MTAATAVFLLVRVFHVLLAAVWVGVTAFITLFLMPSVKETGPGAGPIMQALVRRKLHIFIASVGGTVVLSGFYLYWRFTGGFEPSLSGTMAARVFGAGGLAGLLALIVGGAVVSKNAKKMADLGARLMSTPEGAERGALAGEMTAARDKAATFGRVVLVLQVIALTAMAVGHYM